ncbi:MAG: hypothetical protein R3F62_07285 [Planctomycetota bacterium]
MLERLGPRALAKEDGCGPTSAPQALEQARGWLDEQRALWERRLDQLDAYLETPKDPP